MQGKEDGPSPLRILRDRIAKLPRYIKGSPSDRISSSGAKETVRTLVDEFFRELRPAIIARHGVLPRLTDVDGQMQDLLRCAQRRTAVAGYRQVIKELTEVVDELEIQALAGGSKPEPEDPLDPRDRMVARTLTPISPSAARSYEQACLDLLGPERLSWRGTAVELREALREVVHAMAPDSEVKRQTDFKLETRMDRPTTKQRVRYILKSRKLGHGAIKASEEAIDVVENSVAGFVRSLQEASHAGTHGEATKDAVLRVKNYLVPALEELLEIPPS